MYVNTGTMGETPLTGFGKIGLPGLNSHGVSDSRSSRTPSKGFFASGGRVQVSRARPGPHGRLPDSQAGYCSWIRGSPRPLAAMRIHGGEQNGHGRFRVTTGRVSLSAEPTVQGPNLHNRWGMLKGQRIRDRTPISPGKRIQGPISASPRSPSLARDTLRPGVGMIGNCWGRLPDE